MSWGFVKGCVMVDCGGSGGEIVVGSDEICLAGEWILRSAAVVRRKIESI